jgi:hypothetical protein
VTALGPSHLDHPFHGLWSLWEMFKDNAIRYIQLGARLQDSRAKYLAAEEGNRKLTEDEKVRIGFDLMETANLCNEIRLPVSADLLAIRVRKSDLPETAREMDLLSQAVFSELRSILFTRIPSHVAQYYEWDGIITDAVVKAFPKASEEIQRGGTCLAVGLNTACVFHVMRAAEIGVRALGNDLKIKIKSGKPIELAEWREILDGLATAVRDIENLPNSTPSKDADLLFYSEASAQFRFFKNGWRVRVAHARASYNEPQAIEAIDHVRSFFEVLAPRLKE